MLRKGRLVDIMRARAEAGGQQPNPTYQAGTGARTQIDGIFTDPRVAAMVKEERVVPKPELPGHDLLRVIIALDMAFQRVTKIRKMEDPQDRNLPPQEQHDLANMFWSSLHWLWGAALRAEDTTDAMWSTWTWAAEEFLLLDVREDGRAGATLRTQWPGPPVLRTTGLEMDRRGRGTTRTMTVTKLCPNKKLPSGAPKTRAIRLMDAVRGSRKPVQRYVRWQEESPEAQPARWPREVERSWQSARKGLTTLQQEQNLPEGVAIPPADALYTDAGVKRLAEALGTAAQD